MSQFQCQKQHQGQQIQQTKLRNLLSLGIVIVIEIANVINWKEFECDELERISDFIWYNMK